MIDNKSQNALLGANIEFLEQQFAIFQSNPDALDKSWQDYFTQLAKPNTQASYGNGLSKDVISTQKIIKQTQVTELINSFRLRGHEHAKVDPLELHEYAEVREISLAYHGLDDDDLDTIFSTASVCGSDQNTLRELLFKLRQTYCGSIGSEFMHILDSSKKSWIQDQLEEVNAQPKLSPERRTWILNQLTAAEGLELYLHNKYTGQKRFSLEGGESLLIALNSINEQAADTSIDEIVLGMAHRGRLNVLINVFGKNPADLFSEFDGIHNSGLIAGDVKYHQGFSSNLRVHDRDIHLALAFNPSHLEIVNPVVQGSVRARQDRRHDTTGDEVLAIAIHGDASFSGQGVIMESFGMSGTRGYSTHGTIHIVVNNQVGFTTSNPLDSRSTPYCTDIAKMVNAPIFHVNGDDPDAVFFVTKLAFEYRTKFKEDVIIDLVCYRRHGHNEADEPSATQPMMYKIIKKLPTTRKLYGQKLVAEKVISSKTPSDTLKHYRKELELGKCIAPNIVEHSGKNQQRMTDWSKYLDQDKEEIDTTLSKELLQTLGKQMLSYPKGYEPHPRVIKIYTDRLMMMESGAGIDWGCGETLAYASLLNDKFPIRFSGQDAKRGTFFHRNAVLYDMKDGEPYTPLQQIPTDANDFCIIDSLLSEEAVLGFEYGYSTTSPNTLCIWEAQFGDFVNGAQVVIDQFITSGEVKWGRLCGLVLLLPHGYEGQGPEHSSARPERFLQLCADDNMNFIIPSTPAQVFHMMRRQVLRHMRRPLIVMTPKSLLRNPKVVSSLDELTSGGFQAVIDDNREDLVASKVTRIILCSGKVYYDILQVIEDEKVSGVALVRIEELYPFPYDALTDIINKYGKAKDIIWVQEEPRNQGAWYFIRPRLERILQEKHTLFYRGRYASASVSVGYSSVHVQQQAYFIACALGLKEWEYELL